MTVTDSVIADIGLVSHPPLRVIIDRLRYAADRLHRHGHQAKQMAAVLSASGYPHHTLGDGGSRGTDTTSSTERKAIEDPERWAGVDSRLASLLAVTAQSARELDYLVANIVYHAEDLDPVPVGTGYCQACARFCRPDKERPGNRLVSGLCPTDYRAWRRYVTADGGLSRGDWIHQRRKSFTDYQSVVRTPEPDHDLDMSTELLSA